MASLRAKINDQRAGSNMCWYPRFCLNTYVYITQNDSSARPQIAVLGDFWGRGSWAGLVRGAGWAVGGRGPRQPPVARGGSAGLTLGDPGN